MILSYRRPVEDDELASYAVLDCYYLDRESDEEYSEGSMLFIRLGGRR